MNLKDVTKEVEEDLKFSLSTISEDMVKQPLLHHKWVKRWTKESIRVSHMQEEYDSIFRKRLGYYLKDYQYDLDTKTAVRMANSDVEVQDSLRMLRMQEQLVSYLKEVIGMFNQRNYTISNAIKFIIFREGS